MVLVTGPTGSGKTNTLYSALQSLNTVDTNIMTAEDPLSSSARRQPGADERTDRIELCCRPPFIPAAGSEHCSGR